MKWLIRYRIEDENGLNVYICEQEVEDLANAFRRFGVRAKADLKKYKAARFFLIAKELLGQG